jgi:hypothetical protein
LARRNPFTKEYYTGRKDQFDIDYSIFRKAVEETQTREELIKYLEERFTYVISRIAVQNARELMEELELV